MHMMRSTTLLLLGLLLSSAVAGAQRRSGISAREALDRVAAKHGQRLVGKIAEMTGRRGQTQPAEWWIVVHDESSRYRVRTMWVGDVRATDEGENDEFYPARLPVGYASVAKLKIDSTAAFEVLVREARHAKVGFDSVDYKLRSAEFGDEPIWSLTARDVRRRVVGRVILSGFDARVFRTVWFYPQRSGYPRIVDSALDGLRTPEAPSTPVESPLERPGPDPLVPEPPDPVEPAPPVDPATPVDPGDPGTERAVVEPLAPPGPKPTPPAE